MDITDLNVDSLLTSHQAGSLLQVNPSSIVNWVREGRIPAFRTPGGHRRIRAGDLVTFLSAHSMPVPHVLQRAARHRILIVDDDKSQLSALERLFKPYARYIELTVADNGIEALVNVGLVKPHIVVLDVFMPDINGIEVCKRLKASADTQNIKVVITSGQLTPDLEEKAKEAGAFKVAAKPLDVPTVMQWAGVPEHVLEAVAALP